MYTMTLLDAAILPAPTSRFVDMMPIIRPIANVATYLIICSETFSFNKTVGKNVTTKPKGITM